MLQEVLDGLLHAADIVCHNVLARERDVAVSDRHDRFARQVERLDVVDVGSIGHSYETTGPVPAHLGQVEERNAGARAIGPDQAGRLDRYQAATCLRRGASHSRYHGAFVGPGEVEGQHANRGFQSGAYPFA